MDEQKIIKETKKLLSEFLTQMGLDADVAVSINPSDNEKNTNVKYLNVQLTGEHLNELVGYHGKNLEAAQVVLGLILSKKIDNKDYRLLLEINDYKERREQYLISYAQRAAMQVKESGQDMELPPMKPNERRIVHLTLKKEQDITSQSIGEGEERRIVISKSK